MATKSVPVLLSVGLLAGLLLGTLRNVTKPTSTQEEDMTYAYYDVIYEESDVYGAQEDNMSESGTHLLLVEDTALHNGEDLCLLLMFLIITSQTLLV